MASYLEDLAGRHDRDAVRHGQGFFWSWVTKMKVMPVSCCSRFQLDLHFLAQLVVECGERLVEQQDLRLWCERPGNATRCCWPPEIWLVRRLLSASILTSFSIWATRAWISSFGLPSISRPKPMLSAHRHVREQRIGLEDGVDRTLERRQRCDVLTVEQDFAGVGKSKRLSASGALSFRNRGPEQVKKLVLAIDTETVSRAATCPHLIRKFADVYYFNRIPTRFVRHDYASLLTPALAGGALPLLDVTTRRMLASPALTPVQLAVLEGKPHAHSGLVGDFAATDGRHRPHGMQRFRSSPLDIGRQNDEIRQITRLQYAFAVFHELAVGALDRITGKRFMQRETLVRQALCPRFAHHAAWMPRSDQPARPAIGSEHDAGPASLSVRQA